MNNNRFNLLDEDKKFPKKRRFDFLKEEPSRPQRRLYNSRKNTNFKPPILNSRFDDLKKDVLKSPKSDERHGSLKTLPRVNSRFQTLKPTGESFREQRRGPPRLNSRFESLKPIEKLPREPRRERFRQTEPVEEKFEKIGSMEGMFNNLSVKPKQKKKKKKKKKQEAIYEDDEKDKEDKLLTLKMAQAYMYHTDDEEEVQEDNSAW